MALYTGFLSNIFRCVQWPGDLIEMQILFSRYGGDPRPHISNKLVGDVDYTLRSRTSTHISSLIPRTTLQAYFILRYCTPGPCCTNWCNPEPLEDVLLISDTSTQPPGRKGTCPGFFGWEGFWNLTVLIFLSECFSIQEILPIWFILSYYR